MNWKKKLSLKPALDPLNGYVWVASDKNALLQFISRHDMKTFEALQKDIDPNWKPEDHYQLRPMFEGPLFSIQNEDQINDNKEDI